MNNQKVDPTTLSEIYNEQLFFNASSITHNNQFEYLMKIPPPWAREHFRTVGDICKKNAPGLISMEELLSANAQKTFRYGPKSKDLTLSFIKLIPDSRKQKILNGCSQTEELKTKVKHRTLNGKWRIAEINLNVRISTILYTSAK